MTHKSIQADSFHQFSPDRLIIAPALLGERHTFMFSGKQTSVELPSAAQGHLAKCIAWRTEGNVPLEYQVNTVTLRCAVGHTLSVPEEALKVPPRRDTLFTKFERQHLHQLIDEHSEVAIGAFQYWLTVLRWKSGIGTIGEPEVNLPGHSSGGSALQDRATGHRFWLQTTQITVQGTKVVTPSHWQSAQEAFDKSKTPPIWFEFIFQCDQRINNHDLTAAIPSLAIALEVMVRTLITHHLLTLKIEPLINEIIDQANMRLILRRLRSLSFWNNDWERVADISDFNKLMDYRNQIMHSADTPDLKTQDLRKLHNKVKSFAYFVSEFLKTE